MVNECIDQYGYLKTIEGMWEHEDKQIKLFTDVSLSKVPQKDYDIEEIKPRPHYSPTHSR